MSELSNYEILRQQNILKNAAFLQSLGIDETKKNIVAQASATVPVEKKKKRVARKLSAAEDQFDLHFDGCRKSARVRGQAAASEAATHDELDAIDAVASRPRPARNIVEYVSIDPDEAPRNRITATSLGDFIERCSPNHYEMVSNGEISHTVMRIQSMSNNALANRIKSIGRSPSDTSKRKMLVFYYGLEHANLRELAAMAAKVLTTWYRVEGVGGTNGGLVENVESPAEEKEEEQGDVIRERSRRTGSPLKSKAVRSAITVAPELLVLLKVPAGGVEVLTRPTIVQYIWKYIKAQGLQNLRDKRKIEFGVDNPLGRILGVQRTTMFGLQKVISEHIASCNSSGVSEAESKTIEGEKSS